MHWFDSRSHIWICPSRSPDSARVPAGSTAMPPTSVAHSIVFRHLPEATSHSLSVPSSPPESARALSRSATTVSTKPVWPSSFANFLPVLASQTQIESLSDADRIRLPSGVTAMENTLPACPCSVSRHAPVSKSQILTAWSSEPVAAHVPSELTTALTTQTFG